MKRSTVISRALSGSLILFVLTFGSANAQRIRTIYLDDQGSASIHFSGDEIRYFNCASVGVHTLVLNADVPEHKVQVSVADTTRPHLSCSDFSVELGAANTIKISAADMPHVATDNCSIAWQTVAPNMFTAQQLGANTISLWVTDVHGNTASCKTTVVVTKNTAPAAVVDNSQKINETNKL